MTIYMYIYINVHIYMYIFIYTYMSIYTHTQAHHFRTIYTSYGHFLTFCCQRNSQTLVRFLKSHSIVISYGTCSSGMTFEKFCQKNLQTLLKFQKSHPATKCSIQNHYRADFGDTLQDKFNKQDKYSQTSIPSADFGDTSQENTCLDFKDTLQDKK